jgi:signal transduction histidine kinase
VRDIAIAYGGSLDIDDSPRLGGARVTVRLPAG